MHGGKAPQVRRKREERVALAEALAADPRRSPAEVLSSVLHAHDHLMRKALREVDANRPTAKTMTALLAELDQTGRWAKTALDAEVDQRQTRVAEVEAAVLVGLFERALGRAGLQPAQLDAAKEALADELEQAAIEGTSDGGA